MKKIAEILLSKERVEQCIQFGNHVTPTVDYKDSNQINSNKVQSDHATSKMGEWATYDLLVSKGYKTTEPDMAVYKKDEKNWDSDLMCIGRKGEYVGHEVPLAVKSQSTSQGKKFGTSWTFQDITGGRRDPILNNPNDFVVFVTVHSEKTNDGVLCSIYKPKKICELNFGAPKSEKLKGKKKVVYECDN